MERIARQTPAVLRVGQAGQRVGDRIQVGRDVEAVQLSVVGRIADDPEKRRVGLAGQTVEESRRADAARQSHDRLAHSLRPVIRSPECFTLCRMLREISSAAALSIRRALSSGPASTARAPASIAIIPATTDLASALSPQMSTSLSIG